jgi:hypothetical protein
MIPDGTAEAVSMRKPLSIGLFAAVLLAASAPRGQAQLVHTDPDHYSSGAGQSVAPLDDGRGVPDFRSKNPTSRVLMEARRRLQDSGPPDRRLTDACRDGRFRQAVEHRYIARLDGRTYGAGIGGRPMLHDPQRMGQPGVLYVFVGQGTTNCRVYTMGFPAAG